MVKTATCPHCDALYQVVKAEPGPEAVNGDIACRACRGPLAACDGEFVLKYFSFAESGSPTGAGAKASARLWQPEIAANIAKLPDLLWKV